MSDLLKTIKKRCGISENVTVYDDEINSLSEAAKMDMKISGVPDGIMEKNGAVTAISCYVRAYLGQDRENSELYIKLYRDAVFRLTLQEEGDGSV